MNERMNELIDEWINEWMNNKNTNTTIRWITYGEKEEMNTKTKNNKKGMINEELEEEAKNTKKKQGIKRITMISIEE